MMKLHIGLQCDTSIPAVLVPFACECLTLSFLTRSVEHSQIYIYPLPLAAM